MTQYEGSCKCGNILLSWQASLPIHELEWRACQCNFCRQRNAVHCSDPRGVVEIRLLDELKVNRYRFATKTADFLICLKCNTYVAAVLDTGKACYATLSVRAFVKELPVDKPVHLVNYGEESAAERFARRVHKWTPCKLVEGQKKSELA